MVREYDDLDEMCEDCDHNIEADIGYFLKGAWIPATISCCSLKRDPHTCLGIAHEDYLIEQAELARQDR